LSFHRIGLQRKTPLPLMHRHSGATSRRRLEQILRGIPLTSYTVIFRRFEKRLFLKDYGAVKYGSGESVSQSLLKDRVFSTFLDQNPPFELRRLRSLQLRSNSDIREFYLGMNEAGSRKSYRDVKRYKRRKRWLS
jgi:hypothetical protein